MSDFDALTEIIIHEAIKLHIRFGPGLLESFYEAVLCRALERQGLVVERQKAFGVAYEGLFVDEVCRIDLMVAGSVIVELKSVERLHPVHHKQLLTYLRVAQCPLGLLLNFGAPTLKEGIRRVVNELAPSASPRLRVNRAPTA